MVWVLRGLREGIVTTRYPARPDGYGPQYRGAISVLPDTDPSVDGARHGDEEADELKRLCPSGAIGVDAGLGPRVDRGRCILCGRCVQDRPDRFSFSPTVEPATTSRTRLVVPYEEENPESLERLRSRLHDRTRALRRSIHLRHVDAGSDGAEEWEVAALLNPIYDVQRLGLFFTATPRHADVLLVTGTGTSGMSGPLRRTFEAIPDPKIVVAVGTDAVSGGLVHPTYSSGPGISSIVPVDVWVPGSPPSPFAILHGILLGVGLLPERGEAR